MHRIDGPGATADNMFTEGDPVAGTPATVVTDDFMNAVQEELIGILSAAGVTPSKASQDQVLQAIYKLAQSQKATAFATAGTATALTLTPVPAISAYAANQRFSVKFSVASGANPTLNVSGLGGKSLKKYDTSGAKVAAAFAAGQISDVVYDGADMVVLTPLPVDAAPDASTTVKGITRLATPAEAIAGSSTTIAVTPAGLESKIPLKSQCTAWVNFNGTGTVAIRDSYNCLSVTDNGTGDYTVNLLNQTKTTYSFATGTSVGTATGSVSLRIDSSSATYNTTQLRLVNGNGSASITDAPWASVQIFGGQ
ncbi:hypothetical protein HBO38_03760 [Pseudomonas veronii]|uniref:Phage tail protein n=1 Tax=Pseudomonas veronii TaxID=76761 RepID=A0A7Y1A1S1_PSEVE|nr:hypothetical protein [Pseudomonas veronii]NMY07572.1 hypothetical protein [Pseudomonas veronii]